VIAHGYVRRVLFIDRGGRAFGDFHRTLRRFRCCCCESLEWKADAAAVQFGDGRGADELAGFSVPARRDKAGLGARVAAVCLYEGSPVFEPFAVNADRVASECEAIWLARSSSGLRCVGSAHGIVGEL
jgi:hypothetical protein